MLRSAQGSSGRPVEGAGARVEQARQRAATTATRVEEGENTIPAPMGRRGRGWPSRRHGIWKSTSRSAASRVRQRGAARCVENGLSGAMTTGLFASGHAFGRPASRPVGAEDNGEVKWMARSFA